MFQLSLPLYLDGHYICETLKVHSKVFEPIPIYDLSLSLH